MTPVFSICHTSARPHAWRAAYDAYMDRAVHPERVEYVLCVDDRWGFPADFAMPARGGLNVLCWNRGRKCAVSGWNTACAASSGSVIIQGSDDVFPPQSWDEALLAAAPDLAAEFVIRVNTQNPNQARNLFAAIESRARYLRRGFGLYPEYDCMYADDDFCEHALQDGCVIDARHIQFDEQHPIFTGAPLDAVNRHQERPEAYALGLQILKRRREVRFAV